MPGVVSVHELHVWTVTSGFVALSAHVVASPDTDRDAVRMAVEFLLRDRYEIEHSTIQMEEEPPKGRSCSWAKRFLATWA